MLNENNLLDIQEQNLSYLLLAQRLCCNDLESGAFRLGIDIELAEVIANLSASQLVELSRCSQLLCRPSIASKEQLCALINKPREQGLNSLHMALLLAGDES